MKTDPNTIPLISVIVPAYNTESYLSDCIQSILNQTIKDLEIILIDDGSTDHTGALCDQLVKEHKNIQVHHQENRGPSGARNTGMKLASGKWISFVDSDDLLHPQTYEFLLKASETTHSKMAFCGFRLFEDKEVRSIKDFSIEALPIDFFKPQEFIESDLEIISIEDEFRRILKIPCYTTVWRGIYDRETIKGISFEEGMIFEDVIWAFKSRGTQETIVNIPYALYYYRQRTGSAIHQAFNLKKFDRFKALEMTLDYLKARAPKLIPGIKIDAFTHVINYQFMIWEVTNKKKRREYQKMLDYYRREFQLSMKELLACKDARTSRKMFVLFANVSFPLACLLKKWGIWIYNLRTT